MNPVLSCNNPDYKTSVFTYLYRVTLVKIFELVRGLFHPLSSCLSNRDVMQNLSHVHHVDYLLLHAPQTSPSLENWEPNPHAGQIFLPINIRGRLRNHIVFFAINRTTREIIFYDSKGWTVADNNLQAAYQRISSQFPDYTFVQNVQKEQYDTFNCGAYVTWRIRCIYRNYTTPFLQTISEHPSCFSNAMKERCPSRKDTTDDVLHHSNLLIQALQRGELYSP